MEAACTRPGHPRDRTVRQGGSGGPVDVDRGLLAGRSSWSTRATATRRPRRSWPSVVYGCCARPSRARLRGPARACAPWSPTTIEPTDQSLGINRLVLQPHFVIFVRRGGSAWVVACSCTGLMVASPGPPVQAVVILRAAALAPFELSQLSGAVWYGLLAVSL